MFDMASISSALVSAKAILELAKNANDAQLATKISAEVANVQGQLIDVQQQALGIQAENQQLREQLEKLQSYVHHHSVTWRRRSDATEEGPYCPACFGEGKTMPLILVPNYDQNRNFWSVWCPKGHIDPRVKPQGPWQGAKQEAVYRIPKELVPNDRFYSPFLDAP